MVDALVLIFSLCASTACVYTQNENTMAVSICGAVKYPTVYQRFEPGNGKVITIYAVPCNEA